MLFRSELIGGYTIARELVLKAIENGKHVVTANKALIAVHGNEIFAKAQEKGVIVAFEAAVAGGIPVIKAIREGLSANRLRNQRQGIAFIGELEFLASSDSQPFGGA